MLGKNGLIAGMILFLGNLFIRVKINYIFQNVVLQLRWSYIWRSYKRGLSVIGLNFNGSIKKVQFNKDSQVNKICHGKTERKKEKNPF